MMDPVFWIGLARKYGLQVLAGLAVLFLMLWIRHAFVKWEEGVYQSGWDARDADWKADTAKREAFGRAEREKLQLAYDQIAIDQNLIAAQQQRKREIEIRNIRKKEIIYRENPDAGKCDIPTEFVCIVDTSYLGLPEEAAEACSKRGANGRISDVELLSYSTDTKGTYAQCWAEVEAWRAREDAIEAVELQFKKGR